MTYEVAFVRSTVSSRLVDSEAGSGVTVEVTISMVCGVSEALFELEILELPSCPFGRVIVVDSNRLDCLVVRPESSVLVDLVMSVDAAVNASIIVSVDESWLVNPETSVGVIDSVVWSVVPPVSEANFVVGRLAPTC